MKFSLKGLLVAAVAFLSIIFAFSFVFGTASGDIELKERIFFKWKNSLDVTVAGKDEGKVAESVIQLSRTFTWTDERGKTAASASVAIISIGTDIYVYNGAGNRVGSIEERIFSRWGKTWSGYDIKDARGNKIASSDKTEFMGTTITLTAPDGTKLAKLNRPWVNVMGDSWGIEVLKPGVVDNRILVMIAAFKTAADRDKESGSSQNTSKKK